jgi:hypothetical protein
MQFGGNGATSGTNSAFRLLCSNSSPKKHSYRHQTTVLSGSLSALFLAVPLSEIGLKGTRFATM